MYLICLFMSLFQWVCRGALVCRHLFLLISFTAILGIIIIISLFVICKSQRIKQCKNSNIDQIDLHMTKRGPWCTLKCFLRIPLPFWIGHKKRFSVWSRKMMIPDICNRGFQLILVAILVWIWQNEISKFKRATNFF